ncbi:MAG: hypothetical protein Q7R33_00820 [Nitrosarchaeum sp.]|nr:hypothetical protein [Nitrosarchaeum sp.]
MPDAILTTFLNCLQTDEGKMRLAACMYSPVQQALTSLSVARKYFQIKLLRDGELPTFEISNDANLVLIGEGQNITLPLPPRSNRKIYLEIFEIQSNFSLRFSEVRQLETVPRIEQHFATDFAERENELFFDLLTYVCNHCEKDIIVTSKEMYDNIVKDFDLILMNKVDENNDGLISMNIVNEDSNEGHIFKLDDKVYFYTGLTTEENTFYAFKNIVGGLPVRVGACMPSDDPENLRIGFTCFEQIGMGLFGCECVRIIDRKDFNKTSKFSLMIE